MTSLFRRIDDDDDDFVGEDLPRAFGVMGPGAIPALTSYLADDANGLWARAGAAHALEEIGNRNAEARQASVAALTRQLEQFAQQDLELNGLLVAFLLDLNAVEAAPVIEQAFRANRVELSAAGDWEDAQIALGLIDRRLTPRRLRPTPDAIGVTADRIASLLRPPAPTSKHEFEARAERAVLQPAPKPKRKRHRRKK